ncbi:erythromycin resistance leader peptide [Corynebacterium guaraldiae]|nr:erythromycin resistance leader peptide [Corynebacterium guaraldiae]
MAVRDAVCLPQPASRSPCARADQIHHQQLRRRHQRPAQTARQNPPRQIRDIIRPMLISGTAFLRLRTNR